MKIEPDNNNEIIRTSNFFVDESGDLNLFDKKGRIILDKEGVSNFFMVGVALIPNIELVDNELTALRTEICNDPYFKGVPSLNSTSNSFHACKDLPEVRREVLKLLPNFNASVFIAIKRKKELAEFAKSLFILRNEKLRENDIYDDLVKRLFRNLLHKAESNTIYFATRGKAKRTDALEKAINKARQNFETKYNISSQKPTKIISLFPAQSPGLQVIDYYLWALQRMYERGEDRFFSLLSSDYKLIMDLDDKRNKPYGEWYSEKNLLALEKIKPLKS